MSRLAARVPVPAISGRTRVVAVLGWPVAHSRSPAMHNAAFAALGLDYRYVAFAVPPKNLRHAVHGLRALGMVGANVTIPLKELVIPMLDDVSPEARIIGAVNTIVCRDGRLIGQNTDARGFLRSLREDTGVTVRGGRFLVVGAGGAARAVAAGLAMSGARAVVVANRSTSRAQGLVRRFRRLFPGVEWVGRSLEALPPARTLRAVIQCTSVGMRPEDGSPVPIHWLEPRVAVYDLIYHTPTALLRRARALGSACAGGVGMLLHQGALAFTVWTGRRPPIQVMRRALIHSIHTQ
ncbi:MAG: shikimate dehydrogenase [Nitrospirota bacterium]